MTKTINLILLLLLAVPAMGQAHRCVGGVLDLSDTRPQDLEPTALIGEWELYWNQLLTPADLAAADAPRPANVEVPIAWKKYTIEGRQLPPHGFATYRLRIELPESATDVTYGLQMRSVYSSYVLWINGEVAAEAGTVGTTEQQSKPAFRNQLLPIVAKGGSQAGQSLELVIQVSNFDHQRCGLFDSFTIGDYETLRRQAQRSSIGKMLLVGILVLIGLNHALHYTWSTTNRSNLYFALACAVLLFRNLAQGDRIISFLLPNMGWELLFKLDNLSAFCSIPFFCLFFSYLYPKQTPPVLNKVVIGLGAAIGALILFTPVDTHSRVHAFLEAYVALGGLYNIYILARAVKQREPYALYSFIGLIALFTTAIVDVVKSNEFLADLPNLAPTGMVAMAVLQSAATERRSVKASLANETLKKEIQDERDRLEMNVMERTREMQRQNDELTAHQKKEEERNRLNVAIASINEIAAQHRTATKAGGNKVSEQEIADNKISHYGAAGSARKRYNEMYQKVLKETLKQIGAQVGAIYVVNRDHEPPTLDLAAAFGLDKNTQWNNAQMPCDDGLLGETYQFGATHLLTHVPEGYINIESATGAAAPRALLIAPLSTDDEVVGAIEIASFNNIGPAEQEFVEKAAAIIAHNVSTITNNERNERLIRDFEARAAQNRETEERLQNCLRDLQQANEEIERLRRQAVEVS